MIPSIRRRARQAEKAIFLSTRPIWRRSLRLGVAASIEHRPLAALGALRTVVDIGANRGQFALFCHATFPEAKIFSFEPLPGPRSLFAKVFAGEPRVRLFDNAIGTTAGTAAIHLSKRDDSSSLLAITQAQVDYAPGTEEIGSLDVKVAPLSDLLDRSDIQAPALLKIDVQGFELQALEGCASLLDAFDHVLVEASFRELYGGQALADEIIAFLARHKLVLRGFYNSDVTRTSLPVQADFLFGRR